MRIPIRIIGVATTIFWVFLIGFCASAALSAKDIRFDFGDPQIGLTINNELLFSLPIGVSNEGFYSIGDFNVASRVSDAEGNEIARANSFVPVIGVQEEVTMLHNITVDMEELVQRHEDYIFNDTELTIHEKVGLSLATIIPVEASGNLTVPWGAPLYNFALGQPEASFFNATHFRITVPLSFENHAPFDLVGSLQVFMFDNRNTRIGEGQTNIDAPHQTGYSGQLEFFVSTASVIIPGTNRTGRFDVYLFSSLFDYGPWVIPYG